jgi:hypothetical protein
METSLFAGMPGNVAVVGEKAAAAVRFEPNQSVGETATELAGTRIC